MYDTSRESWAKTDMMCVVRVEIGIMSLFECDLLLEI
ncbi:unnamed protein product [Brassica oleracea var. botrytis]